jgi:hypothetical protein
MNSLTLEQTNLLNEYILSYKLLNITNDFAVYDCLQNRLTNIIKRLGFQKKYQSIHSFKLLSRYITRK